MDHRVEVFCCGVESEERKIIVPLLNGIGPHSEKSEFMLPVCPKAEHTVFRTLKLKTHLMEQNFLIVDPFFPVLVRSTQYTLFPAGEAECKLSTLFRTCVVVTKVRNHIVEPL